MTGSRRYVRAATGLLVLAALFPATGAAQVRPLTPPGAFRTSLGVAAYASGTNTDSLLPAGAIPSGRATLQFQLTPGFGMQAGAVRLAPSDGRITAGVGGVRYNMLRNRFRFAPFLEAGAGPSEAILRDRGYWTIDDSGDRVFSPVPRRVEGLALGGGAGVDFQLLIGGGIALELSGGYYHFEAPEHSISGPFAGAGVRLAFRDSPWYWRTSGLDRDGPSIRVVAAVDSAGVLHAESNDVDVVLSDLSGIRVAYLNREPVQLERASVQLSKGAPEARLLRLTGLEPGENVVELNLLDRAGNWERQSLRIVAPVPDAEGPYIAVLEPSPGSAVSQQRVTLVGSVTDESEIAEITVAGTRAEMSLSRGIGVAPAGAAAQRDPGRTAGPGGAVPARFSAEVELEPGQNQIVIVARDTRGNESLLEYSVFRRTGIAQATRNEEGPAIQILEPTEWQGAGARGIRYEVRNSIKVVGSVRDVAGVREIRVNGQAVPIQADDPSRQDVRFTGYVPVDPGTEEVEIAAWAADGRYSTRVYRVEPQAAAGVADLTSGAWRGQRFAVVIGVSDYADPGIPDLEYADDDARAFHAFLRSEGAGLGGIPEENLELLLNDQATYRNMRGALNTFLERATEDDIVFVFIAAHGAPNPNRLNQLYVLPYDTEADDLPGSAYPMEHINEAISRLYARHTVLITDACHSGGMGYGEYATRASGDATYNLINEAFLQDLQSTRGGLAIFTASEASQLSREGAQWGGGHGVFTYHLLEGLRGAADVDQDRIVRLGELMEYVRDRVRRETNSAQIPSIGSQSHDRYLPLGVVVEDGAGNRPQQ